MTSNIAELNSLETDPNADTTVSRKALKRKSSDLSVKGKSKKLNLKLRFRSDLQKVGCYFFYNLLSETIYVITFLLTFLGKYLYL